MVLCLLVSFYVCVFFTSTIKSFKSVAFIVLLSENNLGIMLQKLTFSLQWIF